MDKSFKKDSRRKGRSAWWIYFPLIAKQEATNRKLTSALCFRHSLSNVSVLIDKEKASLCD